MGRADRGNNVYREADSVDVVDGLYATTLGDNQSGGSAAGLANALNVLGTNAWLGVQFGADPELTPRERLLSAPFALNVRGIFVDGAGKAGIGTTTPLTSLMVVGGTSAGIATGNGSDTNASRGASFHFYHQTSENARIQSTRGKGDTNGADMAFHTRPAGGALTKRMIINADGRVGIGTDSPSEALDVAGSVKADGFNMGGETRTAWPFDLPSGAIVFSATASNAALTAAGMEPVLTEGVDWERVTNKAGWGTRFSHAGVTYDN